MRLSAHFHIEEFLRSEVAARRGIDMTPSPAVLRNLERLANEVLEPIREAAGCAVVITSGYRPKELNDLIGGASLSDHVDGRAADFHAVGMGIAELGDIVKRTCRSLPVARLIQEFPPHGWLHVSIEPLGRTPSRRYLIASRVRGATVYSDWV